MQLRPSISRSHRSLVAFSVLELLVAVTIMTFIIFALYGMFHQTQKALRANIVQVDVQESGRAAIEMIARDLEGLLASHLENETNFFAAIGPIDRTSNPPIGPAVPLVQTDLDPTVSRFLRTNILQEFFFLNKETNRWIGLGYKVMDSHDVSDPKNGILTDDDVIGTLYRFSTNSRYLRGANPATGRLETNFFINAFLHEKLTNLTTRLPSTNLHRVIDGVVHLRLTTFDGAGRPLNFNTTNTWPSLLIFRSDAAGVSGGPPYSVRDVREATVILRQESVRNLPLQLQETSFAFLSNALPAYVEVELGIVEPAIWEQAKSMRAGPPGQVRKYLNEQAARIHLFRQRIPIRTAVQ
ncbi:MAG: hypothetical protein AB1813_17750 [Verrucomicrobiota bacterium]